MRSSAKIMQLFLAVFFAGLILFNQPIMSIFTNKGTVLGIPVLLFYIFFVWAILILLMALISLYNKSKVKNN